MCDLEFSKRALIAKSWKPIQDTFQWLSLKAEAPKGVVSFVNWGHLIGVTSGGDPQVVWPPTCKILKPANFRTGKILARWAHVWTKGVLGCGGGHIMSLTSPGASPGWWLSGWLWWKFWPQDLENWAAKCHSGMPFVYHWACKMGAQWDMGGNQFTASQTYSERSVSNTFVLCFCAT